uniref:uncharacterized protein LOC124070567 isoform X2 n=1 Tax=Scatophagus argus TaxID=75038 RepID=UPI001ED80E8A|nr:uncharacterized protein LOC124070567 isoform X2 [Scatophagus argus]
MLVVVCLLSAMMTMKSDASTQNITAHSGEEVLLTSALHEKELNNIRWTHSHLMIYPKNNRTKCPHGRCELLSNGSLRFSRVHTNDSGRYRLEVFNQEGKILDAKDFLLMVDNVSSSSPSSSRSSSSSSSVLVPVLMCSFLLLLLSFIITFILMRRLRLRRMVTDLRHDNVYMSMHGHRGNKSKEEEKQQTEEHDSHYVPCKPVVSTETPITQQMQEDAEDIYV